MRRNKDGGGLKPQFACAEGEEEEERQKTENIETEVLDQFQPLGL